MLFETIVEAMTKDFDRVTLIEMLCAVRDTTIARRPEPDVWIGGRENPYMKRWWLIPRRKYPFNVYLHHFLRSDDDRALHDHPWANASILIDGSYIEHMPVSLSFPARGSTPIQRHAGDIFVRESGTMSHRIELLPNRASVYPDALLPVWTIFVTGPKEREWGFHCPQGWKRWQDFTGQDESRGPVTDARVLGAGCGEN